MNSFNPELHLDHKDRANLVAVSTMEGYRVLHQIMRAEVDKFVLANINADPSDEAKVVAAHRMAKAAAQFYQGLTNRINNEIALYTAMREDARPVDVTEGLIDLGESVADLETQIPTVGVE